ncbi:MAG: YicC/YloC family endoribonuclease [Gemmatimonadota bacterium]|nr:YicC/YloC family endoribonuclease [Gemmatimonadota bacterium]
MTGFGTADGTVGGARVSVELRSVNHRFFNPSIKLPAMLARWEGDAREALRRRIARGHVTLSARVDRGEQPAAVIDEAAFAARAAALMALQQRHNLGGSVDVATVLRLPDVVRTALPEDEAAGSPEEFLAVVEAAADGLASSRAVEGERLAAVIGERLGVLASTLERIAAREPERLTAHRDRIRDSVSQLLDGRQLDEQRLAQEIALLAERLDVGEEVDRFRVHLVAFRETLAAGGDGGVGKRLGFLLQELLREANTIGSKAYDAGLQADVVLLKEEMERIREQVENLE